MVELDKRLVEMYGEPISVYTRMQAIQDGVLVDVTEWANNTQAGMAMGFDTILGKKAPTCVTATLWAKIEVPAANVRQDTRGRAHDVLWMAALQARLNRNAFLSGRQLHFKVKLGNRIVKPVVVLDGDGVTIGMPEDF